MSAPSQTPSQLAPAPPSPSRRYQSPGYRAKRVLLGPALRTSQLVHERITKRVALAVFSSDPISSTAYATEEILLVLVGAGPDQGAPLDGERERDHRAVPPEEPAPAVLRQGDLMAMNSLVSSPLRRSSPGTRWSPRRRGRPRALQRSIR